MKKWHCKHRPGLLVRRHKKHPYRALEQLFRDIPLESVISELEEWQLKTLCSAESAFEDTRAKKRMVRFCKRLLGLIQALWLLHQEHTLLSGNNNCHRLNQELEAIAEANRPITTIPGKLRRDPREAVRKFYARYTVGYADAMLLDMLEAILLSHRDQKLRQPDLVFFYRFMRGFVRAGRAIGRQDGQAFT